MSGILGPGGTSGNAAAGNAAGGDAAGQGAWPYGVPAAAKLDAQGSRVVVVGGGLAGIAAALFAVDSGADVILLEGRPRLGGLTTSFQRSFRGGSLWVDTGQHVFMRCCTAYRGLLARLGVTHLTTLQPRLDVEVLIAGSGTRTRLRRTRLPLPAPLHLAPALLGYRAIPPADRLRAALAALRIGRLDQRSPEVDATSFGSWLARRGQSAAATEALWELLTVATLNASAADASLALAAKVVRTGLLESPDGGDLGWAETPLQRLHGEAAERALAAGGAQVRLGTKARSITRVGSGWEVRVTAGARPGGSGRGGEEVIRADGVVLAVPPPVAADLLPPGSGVDAARLGELGTSPIINIHLIFDRKVMEGPFLAVVGSPVQWIFDRTVSSGLAEIGPPGAQYLVLSQSAAQEWVDQPAGDLSAFFADHVRRLLPAARDAELLEVFVTRERTATFRQAPGSLALRPAQATGLPGFALAGAWTDTGWPATMEGAVRSGIAAARETLASMGAVVEVPAPTPGTQSLEIQSPSVRLPSTHLPDTQAPAVQAPAAQPAGSGASGTRPSGAGPLTRERTDHDLVPIQSGDQQSDGSAPSTPPDSPTAAPRPHQAAEPAAATEQTSPGQPWPTSTGGFPV